MGDSGFVVNERFEETFGKIIPKLGILRVPQTQP